VRGHPEPKGSDGYSFRSADVHNFQAVSRAQFSEHAMDVVANRLFSQLQPVRDFFVTETERDQAYELLFPIG
jgi:hypothetical protein